MLRALVRPFVLYGLGLGGGAAGAGFAAARLLGHTPGIGALLVAMGGVAVALLAGNAATGGRAGPSRGAVMRGGRPTAGTAGDDEPDRDAVVGDLTAMELTAFVAAGAAVYGFLGMAVALATA